jgi:hypothetical protein
VCACVYCSCVGPREPYLVEARRQRRRRLRRLQEADASRKGRPAQAQAQPKQRRHHRAALRLQCE